MRIKWALVHFKPNSANKRSTLHSAPPDHLILKLVTPPLSSSPNRKEREEKRRGSVTCWIDREREANPWPENDEAESPIEGVYTRRRRRATLPEEDSRSGVRQRISQGLSFFTLFVMQFSPILRSRFVF